MADDPEKDADADVDGENGLTGIEDRVFACAGGMMAIALRLFKLLMLLVLFGMNDGLRMGEDMDDALGSTRAIH